MVLRWANPKVLLIKLCIFLPLISYFGTRIHGTKLIWIHITAKMRFRISPFLLGFYSNQYENTKITDVFKILSGKIPDLVTAFSIYVYFNFYVLSEKFISMIDIGHSYPQKIRKSLQLIKMYSRIY